MIQEKKSVIAFIISAAFLLASAPAFADSSQTPNKTIEKQTNDKENSVPKSQSSPSSTSKPAEINPSNPAIVNPSDPTGVKSNVPGVSPSNPAGTSQTFPLEQVIK